MTSVGVQLVQHVFKILKKLMREWHAFEVTGYGNKSRVNEKNENVFSLVSLFLYIKNIFWILNFPKHWSKNLNAATDVVKMESALNCFPNKGLGQQSYTISVLFFLNSI